MIAVERLLYLHIGDFSGSAEFLRFAEIAAHPAGGIVASATGMV